MIVISEKLSEDIMFLRTNFYIVNNKLYIDELTFYPASVFGKFTPVEMNYQIGKLIDINLFTKD